MCRSDIVPAAQKPLATLLVTMAQVLATESGVEPNQVVIGPVDFGDEDA